MRLGGNVSISEDEVILRALTVLDGINSFAADLSALERSRAKTTVLLIVLQFFGRGKVLSKKAATEILVNLFGAGSTITGASLIDVTEKLAFDFSGLSVQHSEFVNFDDFWECEFDGTSRFTNCTLRLLFKRED